MAIPNYPAGLPYEPLRDAYMGRTLLRPADMTQVEDGPTIMRNWGVSNWVTLPYQLVLTFAQFEIFDAFVRDTLHRGAEHFMMPVGRPGAALPWPSKRVYIVGGDYDGPKPFAANEVSVSFTLAVNGW